MKIPGSGHQNNNRNLLKTTPLKGENLFSFIITGGIAILFLTSLLPSCKNDVSTVLSLDFVDTLPEMTARDIEIFYSENAKVQIKLVSPHLVNKTEEEPLMIFPEGFTVFFYDSAMNIKSKITADYGISYEKKNIMEARHNVVVENLEKEEKLNTEELFWDREKKLIYSNKFVRLTTGEQVITGDGLTSEEPFDEIVVSNVKGLLELKEEPGP
jgi:LPS export ABC transporter protein LptC